MKLIVGCGYLGSRVARLWQAAGDAVAVVTRRADRAPALRAAGYVPVVADVTNRSSLEPLRRLGPFDRVLYAVAFDRATGHTMREVYVEGLRNTLDALPAPVGRLIYISSTGVYAQTDGGWIDEDSRCEPTRQAARAILEAESVLRAHTAGAQAIVLRLAGIYGPGRIPRRKELLAGKPIAAAAEAWLNLIHVDDAARVVLAVEDRVTPPRTYLVADGHPVRRREYYGEAARLLSAPPPVFARDEDRRNADARGNTDKRVNNARLVNETGYQFLFSNYKQGLEAILGRAL